MEKEKIAQLLEGKIPHDKMMAVPIMLMMIDTKAWKFPEDFKVSEYAEMCNAIENCVELREAFGA